MKPTTRKTKKLRRTDRKFIWHPFTQMRDWMQDEPLVISRGEGNWLIDTDGNRWLDGVSSLWTNVHGHRRPELDKALIKQTRKLAHSTLLGLAGEPSIRLAKRLMRVLPKGLKRVFFSDSGSTSVEIAMKIAYQYHQQAPDGDPRRTKIMAFTNAYHGDTIGSVSLGGVDLYHAIYRPLLFSAVRGEAPYCYRCEHLPKGADTASPACGLPCLASLRALFEKEGRNLCAVVIEPLVQGAAGMHMQPKEWLRGLRELCDEYGVFMVADEVAVGFGKTGTMFACEQAGVVPDILCLAKGIGAGYLPLAATVTTERIHDGFLGAPEENRTFFHGHTFTGNPLACAVAIANLDLFEKEQTVKNLEPKIRRLKKLLAPLKNLSHVGDVRQCGIMTGIELVEDKATKKPYPEKDRIGHRVILEARKYGVIVRPLGDVIVLMPPLSITQDELDLLVGAVKKAIVAVTEQGANPLEERRNASRAEEEKKDEAEARALKKAFRKAEKAARAKREKEAAAAFASAGGRGRA